MKQIILLSALLLSSAALGSRPPGRWGGERSAMIVGGVPATSAEVPWQAALIVGYPWGHWLHCGGTLLSSFHVLSAAQCFSYSSWFSDIFVRVGSPLLNYGGVLVQASHSVNHPDYDPYSLELDISVLFLATPVSIDGVLVIPLAVPHPSTQLFDGQMLTISGWGDTEYYGHYAEVLQRAEVPVVNWASCRAAFEELSATDPMWAGVEITSTMFCAGAAGSGACEGDTGGPAVAQGVVLGVISWSYRCGAEDLPGVYTPVAQATDWIVATAASN